MEQQVPVFLSPSVYDRWGAAGPSGPRATSAAVLGTSIISKSFEQLAAIYSTATTAPAQPASTLCDSELRLRAARLHARSSRGDDAACTFITFSCACAIRMCPGKSYPSSSLGHSSALTSHWQGQAQSIYPHAFASSAPLASHALSVQQHMYPLMDQEQVHLFLPPSGCEYVMSMFTGKSCITTKHYKELELSR